MADEKKPMDSLTTVSFVVLFAAAALFFYMALYRTADQSGKYFHALTQKAEKELGLLSEARLARIQESDPSLKKKEATASSLERGPVSDVPMFLQKINEETIASGMELSQVQKVDETTYRLSAFAPFYRLVHFLFEIEESNLAVQDLDVHPFSIHENKIDVTIKVMGQKMGKNSRLALDDFRRERTKPFRDPFRKDPGTGEPAGPPDVIDLTWKFKLTGIGFGERKSANIDRKPYHEGDLFNNMRVVRIARDRVELESDSQKFFIGFRYKKPVKRP